jgi:hypothetical protein
VGGQHRSRREWLITTSHGKLFSNSQTAATYRNWNAQNSPDGSRPSSPTPPSAKRSLVGQAMLAKAQAKTGQIESHDLSAHTLITPPIGKDGKRIRYSILEVRDVGIND